MADSNPQDIIQAADSLSNLISGLGTYKDKSTHSTHSFTAQDKAQLDAIYRGNWLARKIIDIPAHDATREWRTWNGDDAHVKALEEAEKELNIRGKVNEAMIKSRLYGGAVIMMGTSKNLEAPLKVNRGDLRYLHVLERHNIAGQELESKSGCLDAEDFISCTPLSSAQSRCESYGAIAMVPALRHRARIS